MINKKLTILLTLITFCFVFAETSVFSSISMGDIDPSFKYKTGIATIDSISQSNHNFSTWAYQKNTTFSISFSYSMNNVEDNNGNTSAYDDLSIDEIVFTLPFGNKNVFGFSFYPTNIVDMTNTSESEATLDEGFENTYLKTLETRIGSISNLSLIYGKKINDLSFGTNVSAKFGNYDTNRRYLYRTYEADNETIEWEKYFENKEKTQFFHVTFGGSFLYTSKYGLNLGGNFSLPLSTYAQKLTSSNSTTSYGTVIEEIDSEKYEINDVEWPFEFSTGLSYDFDKYSLSYDYFFKGYNGLNLGFDDSELSNYSRSVIGLSFKPSKKRIESYYKKIVYSVYFSHESRPYQFYSKTDDKYYDISDISGTLSFKLPYNRDRSNVDLRFTYTRSADTNDSLIDNIIKFQINFNSFDNWWLKKERYND
ncbi:MAG: hypothetical protein PF574_06695 [Candidatus Delongbacteria bacterium]|jgi:hypothetical protein|nr:hypothetical protein [Candidatus Delongbacteria bacterium]